MLTNSFESISKILVSVFVSLILLFSFASKADDGLIHSLSNECSRISERESHSYQLLTGHVLSSEIFPPSNYDCFKGDDCFRENAFFVASMKSLNKKSSEGKEVFTVYIGPLKREALKSKSYMASNMAYSFCARQAEPLGINSENAEFFLIDHVDTIKELKADDVLNHR